MAGADPFRLEPAEDDGSRCGQKPILGLRCCGYLNAYRKPEFGQENLRVQEQQESAPPEGVLLSAVVKDSH